MTKWKFMLIAGLLTGACSTPEPVSIHMETLDDRTKFATEDTPQGFNILVRYGRYQFAPNRPLVADECRAKVLEVAAFHAKRTGIEIEPISPLLINVNTDRNILSAETFCEATATANKK